MLSAHGAGRRPGVTRADVCESLTEDRPHDAPSQRWIRCHTLAGYRMIHSVSSELALWFAP